jgi:hydrogenase-4 component E
MTVSQELIGFSAMASLLGIIRVRNMLWGLALVGVALGILPIHHGLQHGNSAEIFLGCVVIATKGICVPLFLNWNALRLKLVRDRTVWLGPGAALLLGAALVVLFYFNGDRFSSSVAAPHSAGFSMAIVAIGLTMMLTRRLAVGVLIGFLILDNGIFMYGFTQTSGMPLIIDLGVLFDLFAGILLAGFVLLRIRSTFEHLDMFRMKEPRT